MITTDNLAVVCYSKVNETARTISEGNDRLFGSGAPLLFEFGTSVFRKRNFHGFNLPTTYQPTNNVSRLVGGWQVDAVMKRTS